MILRFFVLTKGTVYLAVNCFVDLEYFQSVYKTTSKSILWECFGDILLENLKRNLNLGSKNIPIKRISKLFEKAQKEDTERDKVINKVKAEQNKATERKRIDITQSDYDFYTGLFIYKKLPNKRKRNKPYKYDKEILFVLMCLYKQYKKEGWLNNDGLMRINKKKSNSTKYFTYSFCDIAEMAKAKTDQDTLKYQDTINRLTEGEVYPDITVFDENKFLLIKFDLPHTTDAMSLFVVEDATNPIPYLDLKEDRIKKLNQCPCCNRDYSKIRNRRNCGNSNCIKQLQKWKSVI